MGRKEQALAFAELRILNEHNAILWGMAIDGPVFRYEGREYPINSVSAEVILGAQTSKSRSTATRIIGGGMVGSGLGAVAAAGGMLLGGAAKKTTDTSRVHITIRLGDGSVHTISKPTSEEGKLRSFADKLESAVNRKWPIKTPFGTTLELDPSAKPVVAEEGFGLLGSLGLGLLGVGLVVSVIGFIAFNMPMLGVGLISVVISLGVLFFFFYQKGVEHEQDLDQYFPDWRTQEADAKAAEEKRMWDRARKKAREEE